MLSGQSPGCDPLAAARGVRAGQGGRGRCFLSGGRAGSPPAGLARSLARRQPAFPSLPEATWQDGDKLVPARPGPSALFRSVRSENVERQSRHILELFGIKYFNR